MAMPFEPCRSIQGDSAAAIGLLRIKGLSCFEVDSLDVAADAAFGEAQRHPRLEARDRARLHIRMGREEIVQPIRPGVHQPLHLSGAAGVIGLQLIVADVEPSAQILPDCLLALRFGRAAQGGQVIRLDAREVVLGLRVDHAEHRVGVGLAVDVRDSPIVAGDRHASCLRTPSRKLWR